MLAAGLMSLAGQAWANDDMAVQEKAMRVVDSLLPSDIQTRKKDMEKADVPGYVKVVYEAKSRRGWIPIEMFIRDSADYAFLGRMYKLDPGMSPREKAQKAMASRLPKRFERKIIQSGKTPMKGVKEFLFQVKVPKRGPQPVAAYVGKDFGVVGQLFDPNNKNLTEVSKEKWAGSQVAWKDLIKGLKPVYGSADAPVKFAMFTDPECPACQHAKGRIDALMEKHGKDLAGYLLWFPLSIHAHAKPKAKVLACSPADRQSKMFNALKGTEPKNVDDVFSALEDKGIDLSEQVHKCVSSGKAKERLQRYRHFANEMQVNSVPSFYYKGRLYKGFPETEIRQALKSQD